MQTTKNCVIASCNIVGGTFSADRERHFYLVCFIEVIVHGILIRWIFFVLNEVHKTDNNNAPPQNKMPRSRLGQPYLREQAHSETPIAVRTKEVNEPTTAPALIKTLQLHNLCYAGFQEPCRLPMRGMAAW